MDTDQKGNWTVNSIPYTEVPTVIQTKKISKVKTNFFAQIRQVSNTLTPSADVSGYIPVR